MTIDLRCGDCLEILPTLGKVDAVTISDPPFNIGLDYGRGAGADTLGEDEYYAMLDAGLPRPLVLIHYSESIIKFCLKAQEWPMRCLAWVYHANTARQWRMAAWFDVEPDFSAVKQPYQNGNDRRIRSLKANGSAGRDAYDWILCEQVKNVSREKTEHPCQMPLEVMRLIVGITPGQTVLDPFMGSGTTGVACKALGRNFIGIDNEPKYVEIARRRINATTGPLFVESK